jgi:hypothetical protein
MKLGTINRIKITVKDDDLGIGLVADGEIRFSGEKTVYSRFVLTKDTAETRMGEVVSDVVRSAIGHRRLRKYELDEFEIDGTPLKEYNTNGQG